MWEKIRKMTFIPEEDDQINNQITKLDRFVQTFNLPNSQIHFQPKKIKSIDKGVVTLWGLEGSSNMHINFRISEDIFYKMVENQPEQTKFLLENYYKDKGEISN